MAISSTSSSTSATTTSSLDVASIVSQLMTAENKPIDVIKNKISTQQVFISDMGTIKSDVAALQDALTVFEDVASYSNMTASSTDASVVIGSTSVGASVGTHTVSITQAAQATAYNISGFSSSIDLISLDALNGFRLTVGNTSYSTDGSKTIIGTRAANAITAIAKSGLDASNQPASTATDLKNWINGLGLTISANLVQQNGSHWTMQVNGGRQGLGNDFSLSGLIGGKAFSGFSANNSAVSLDPATGFQLSVGGHVYSTLGTYDGSSSNSIATLSSSTTIAALASWVNSLNVDVSAAVVGSSGLYALQLTPKNSASFSTAGLSGAYATGFSASNELVNLDPTNGFQVSIGSKTYKTAGDGAIAISGTGAGGGVTVVDLATWVNNLSGANLSASVVGGGGSYSLEINNVDVLSASAVNISGITSAGSAASTVISGFESETAPLSLIALSDIELTVGATSYSGSSIVGTGIGGSVKLGDLVNWINGLSAGLTASITGSGQAYSLNIIGTDSSTISLTGLKSNTVITGFSSGSNKINLDASDGFQITSNGTTFSTSGSYTLSSLATWINTQSGLTASVVGSGTTYNLIVSHSSDLNADQGVISISGILSGTITSNPSVVTASSASDAVTGVYAVAVTQLAGTTDASITIAGFKNYGDEVDSSYTITIDGHSYSANTAYTVNGHALSAMTATGIGASGSYSTLKDLNDWINALSGAGLSVSSSISGAPKNYNNDNSDIHVLGTTLPSDVGNNGDPYYKLFAGSAPGSDNKHAIAASLFQFISLNTSGTYENSSFTFTSDGSGNLILNAYDQFGNFLASDIQSIADTFYRGDVLEINFSKLNTKLYLNANYDAASLGEQKADKIKEQVEALGTNAGQYGNYIGSQSYKNVDAFRYVGNYIADIQVSYNQNSFDIPSGTTQVDVQNQVAFDAQGSIIVDQDGNPQYVTSYELSNVQLSDGTPTGTLSLIGKDQNGYIVASQDLDVPNIYSGNVTEFDLIFDRLNIKLHITEPPGSSNGFGSPVNNDREIGQMALGIASMASSPIVGNPYQVFQPPYQIDDGLQMPTSITINQFSGLPPNKFVLSQLDGGVMVLSEYNAITGDYEGAGTAIIDSSKLGQGDIQQLIFRDLPAPGGWGPMEATLAFQINNSNATVQSLADLLTSQYLASTPPITDLRTYYINGIRHPYTLQANKDIGPATIAPLYLANVIELSYSSVPVGVSHYRITSEGANVTITAVDASNNILGAQLLSIPLSIVADQKIILDFDSITGVGGNQGGVKIVIDPKISSYTGAGVPPTNSYKNAATLIAQGLAFANKQSGTSGLLAEDDGSGLSLIINGSNGIQLSDNALNASDEVLGTTLDLNYTNVSAVLTNAKYTITDTGGATTTYDAVTDGATINVDGTTFNIDVSALASATVKVSGNHADNQVTPSSASTTSGGTITTNTANLTSIYTLDGGISKYSAAQDAHLTINGISIVRNTNTISDFVTGLTFQVMANPAPGETKIAKVKVELGADNTEKMITDLADAYNKLIKDYNSMTGNANNGRAGNGKAGTFGSSPTTLSFVETVKRKFATGATYNIGTNDANGNPYIMSLAALGLDYQLDGTLKYNSIEYLTSQANGLREKFLKGLRIGYVSPVDNLMTFIKAQSGSSGALAQEMAMENNSINDLNKEQENLQTRLNKIQDNYIAQYSGLNALLFQLNSTSSNLGSALGALTNMAAGK